MGDDTLQRFVDAQSRNFDAALSELRRGRKRTHWMWYVFPQLRGLGTSHMATRYGLNGIEEARAYLDHPVLGRRLFACVDAALSHRTRTAESIFGHPDCLKFRSCLTLFERAAPGEPEFAEALDQFYGGRPDPLTLRALGENDAAGKGFPVD